MGVKNPLFRLNSILFTLIVKRCLVPEGVRFRAKDIAAQIRDLASLIEGKPPSERKVTAVSNVCGEGLFRFCLNRRYGRGLRTVVQRGDG